jgi:pyruvate dehydrogenase E1 component alpha subunit
MGSNRDIREKIRNGSYQNQYHEELSDREITSIWRKWVFNQAFESQVAKAIQDKRIYVPSYLSMGSEHVPACLFHVLKGYHLFAQHRAHSYYLSLGGSPDRLRDELLGLESGCAGGRGGSASIHDPAIRMWGHSGLMGDQVPIAVGMCLASGEKTITVMGDASGEEDYVLAAFGFAATKKLPILFVCEDNDFSILTKVETRRSWSITDVAESFGVASREVDDSPGEIIGATKELSVRLPALININIARGGWHAGYGTDGPPEWNRMERFKSSYLGTQLESELSEIEEEERDRASNIWNSAAV